MLSFQSALVLTLATVLSRPAIAQSAAAEIQGAGIARLELIDDRPTVQVQINGQGPFTFGIETGAPYGAVVAPAMAAKLSLTGGSTFGSRTTVDSMRIGDVLFTRFDVAVTRELGIGGVDGMLGLAVFKNLRLTVDFPGKLVRLSRDTLPNANGRDILTLKTLGSLVGIDAMLGSTSATLLVDTQGSGQSIACHPRITSTIPFDGPTAVVAQAQIGVGNPAPVDLRAGRLSTDVTFGRVTVRRPIVSSLPLPDGLPCILGLTLLGQFSVTVDQRTMRLQLDGPSTIAPSPSLYSVGISIGPDASGRLRVRVVRAGSVAESAGLRVGDEVTDFNGEAATAHNTSSASVRAVVARVVPFPIVINRDGNAQKMTLVPRLLLK